MYWFLGFLFLAVYLVGDARYRFVVKPLQDEARRKRQLTDVQDIGNAADVVPLTATPISLNKMYLKKAA